MKNSPNGSPATALGMMSSASALVPDDDSVTVCAPAVMVCGVSQSSRNLLKQLWSPQLASIMSSPPTPPRGTHRVVVVVVVGQAEGVAGLVDHDARIERAAGRV